MLQSSIYVAVGGALGSLGRYWLSLLMAGLVEGPFPWATVLANISGCLVIGFFATLTGPDGRWLVAPVARDFVMIGICGGYTTFSAFSLQTLTLVQSGDIPRAVLNVTASVVLCLLAVWLGHVAAAGLNAARV
jgi:fluoride exporter